MPSTTNLLQAVNRLLLDIGERQVTSFTSPASRKAKAYLQDAFNDIQMFHQWEWLNGQTSLQDWNGDRAEIRDARRIRNLYYDSGGYRYPIAHIDSALFNARSNAYGGNGGYSDSGSRPLWYTIVNECCVRVLPYPTTVENQIKIVADVVWHLSPPENETDKFPFPERFMTPLYKRAAYMMALRHLGDMNLAQMFQAEFDTIMLSYRTQENRQPTGGSNMYSRGLGHGIL